MATVGNITYTGKPMFCATFNGQDLKMIPGVPFAVQFTRNNSYIQKLILAAPLVPNITVNSETVFDVTP